MPKKKSTRKTKRKSSIKKTWEKFVQRSDSRSLLKDVWKADHPNKDYHQKLVSLHKKYSV